MRVAAEAFAARFSDDGALPRELAGFIDEFRSSFCPFASCLTLFFGPPTVRSEAAKPENKPESSLLTGISVGGFKGVGLAETVSAEVDAGTTDEGLGGVTAVRGVGSGDLGKTLSGCGREAVGDDLKGFP